MMSTLYVTDLDGTLLNSRQSLSAFTKETLQTLIGQGLKIGIATARSYNTCMQVIGDLPISLPLILQNGTMIVEKDTRRYLQKNIFDQDKIRHQLRQMMADGLYPVVYAFIDGQERFSYVDQMITKETRAFLDTRQNDPRRRSVESEALCDGEIYYVMTIGDSRKLQPYVSLLEEEQVLFSEDIYTHDTWLEIMPKEATKGHACLQLQSFFHCDELVVFGDHDNDRSMFHAASKGYAVQNATDKLKSIATGIIDSNDQDGVAKWLKAYAHK